MNVKSGMKKKGLLLITVLCLLFCIEDLPAVRAESTSPANPSAYTEGVILLTPGSSTDIEFKPGRARTLISVITLGQGTVKITLEKDDTRNDLVSMYLIGYPTDPAFVPSFGVTPTKISVNTAVTDTLGGVGVIFILTTINSSFSYTSTVSIALD